MDQERMRKVDYDVEYTWKEKPKLEKWREIKKKTRRFSKIKSYSLLTTRFRKADTFLEYLRVHKQGVKNNVDVILFHNSEFK